MERQALALLLSVVAAATLAGNASARRTRWPALSTAGPFLLTDIRDKVDGRYGLAWESLFPMHQKIAPRSTYVRCEEQTPVQLPLRSVHVVHVHRASVRVPGLAQPLAGVAVTVAVTFQWYGPRDPIYLKHTFHLVPVHGRWTWLLSRERYHLYRDDGCAPAA